LGECRLGMQLASSLGILAQSIGHHSFVVRLQFLFIFHLYEDSGAIHFGQVCFKTFCLYCKF